ncbi:3-keto-disaccharide hydrolase [Dyadobacter sp. BHUBP1]|uniref:3-keto-disaccharide hydrolase n=1 Tax=Dyadobacter sp. BHUBP1 TaxID=3424178 RepID=UPI003D33DB3B
MTSFKTSRLPAFLLLNIIIAVVAGFRVSGDWVVLFDGTKLDGWHSYNQRQAVGWFVENGTLTTDGTGGDLVTDKEYGDFELEFEFKIPKGSNSGVLYKVIEQPDIKRTVFSAPEYQIIDDQNYVVKDSTGKNIGLKPVQLTGANYDMNPPLDATAFKPAESWNTGRIVVSKEHVRHFLNGKLVADYQYGDATWQAKVAKSKFRDWPYATAHHRGKIALQNHNAKEKVWFRNIRIREN